VRVAVTGASGFIGSAVAQRLIEGGVSVIAVDIKRRETSSAVSGMSWVEADVTDGAELGPLFAEYKPDAVAHLAYERDIAKLEADPLNGIQMNAAGFITLFSECMRSGIRRIVWASSTAVYGSAEDYAARAMLTENERYAPKRMYGVYKAFNELTAAWFTTHNDIQSLALRPGIVYGPGRWFTGYNDYSVNLFANAVRGIPYRLQGAVQVVNWLYIKDLAEAFYMALHAQNAQSGSYNIVGEDASLGHAAGIVAELCPSAQIESSDTGAQREAAAARLSGEAAEREFGYRPRYDLRRGAKEYVDWLRANE
jgi:UDP-glucose 4-epimerase